LFTNCGRDLSFDWLLYLLDFDLDLLPDFPELLLREYLDFREPLFLEF
jgi:hypothetical protein